MGLRTLADKGCGLTDFLGEYLKMQLLKDQIAVSREEMAQNKDLKLAQANYYNAQAVYLGKKDPGNPGPPSDPKLKFDTIYIPDPNTPGALIPIRQGIDPKTGEVVKEQRFDSGSTKSPPPSQPLPPAPSGFDRAIDSIFGRGDAGTTTLPSPSIRRFDKDGNPI